MKDRNKKRQIWILDTDTKQYQAYLRNRGVNNIIHYGRATLNELDDDQRERYSKRKHIFKHGDRLYKLSHQYYGDSAYWWIIAWFNNKPTDSHCKLGDEIMIPFPLEDVVWYATREI